MTDWREQEPEDWSQKIGRREVMAFNLHMDFVKDVILHPSDAAWYKERYRGRIALLHADMRRYLLEELDKTGADNAEHQ